MKNILFATTNSRKLKEAQEGCKDFGINIEQVIVKIEEIQSQDTLSISKHKANEVFKIVQKPIVITDTSWNIPALNGFPGGYMKDVAQWFDAEDFLNLIKNKEDKRISFTECIVYKDKNLEKIFSNDYWGVFTDKVRGENGNSIERIAEFNGFTIAERRDNNKLSHDPNEYIWYKFAKWYSKKS